MCWSIFLSLTIFFIVNHLGNSTPLLGPADIVIKFTEKCKLPIPTMVDIDLRLYTRRGKVILQANTSLPFKFSDDFGYDVNVAVKRNGGWKPNFMKFQGTGLCSFVKDSAPDLFKTMSQELKAPEPAKCPLPSGEIHLDYSRADPTSAINKVGMNILPFGEFRLATNITHKGNVIICCRSFVDLVPKKSRGGR